MKLSKLINLVSLFYVVLFSFVSYEMYCQQNFLSPKVRERMNFDFIELDI